MTPQQARAEAVALLANGASKQTMFKVTDYLFVGGAMCAYQLGAARTLQRYAQQRILDRLPFTAAEVVARLSVLGITVPMQESAVIYALGPVGIEITKMRHDVTPASGFVAYSLVRVIHDVVVNEIVLRIARLAESQGWTPTWMSKYEASLIKDKHQILEPDALLRLVGTDGSEQLYLFEYHNEDKSTRALAKVRKYESARKTNLWSEAWQTDLFPPVLAVFRNKVVAKGYQNGIAEQADGGCQFFGRSLGKLLDDLETWYDFRKKKKGKLFPWAAAS